MRETGLKEAKAQLRAQYKEWRQQLEPSVKKQMDDCIRGRILRLSAYQKTETVLCYVSTDREIDTRALIPRMIADGKRVAVPRCAAGQPEIAFYYIDSLDDLSAGAYAILEPPPDPARLFFTFPMESVTNHSAFSGEAICLVPGLCFDRHGYRLGYGKGYYDRFLSVFTGAKLGLCYADYLVDELPHGRFDCCVDTVITDTISR